MIVLHQQRIISLKARKVGGTSFEIALSQFADETSVITPITASDEEIRQRSGWRGPQNYEYSKAELAALSRRDAATRTSEISRPMKYFNHMPAAQVRERVGEATWNNYKKVAIIRNPFDYMVSSYFWKLKTEQARAQQSFETFVLSRPDLLLFNRAIYQINGANIIDFLIRYEHLEDDLMALEAKIPAINGIAKTFLNINAKGSWRPRDARTDIMFKDAPRAKALICKLCADEIAQHQYEIPEAK